MYIAGPMTGHPDYNYPSFHTAGQWLQDHGFKIRSGAHLNQMELDPPEPGEEQPHHHYMRNAIRELTYSDLIYLLDGWENSPGAQLEVEVAQALGIKQVTLQDLPTL